MICGLLGRRLGHSYSPQIHKMLGAYDYRLFEKEPRELERFLRSGEFTGLNVTMPYKRDIIPLLDTLSPVARQLGAVNTVIRRPDGTLVGHNTDAFGFRSLLSVSGLQPEGKKCLVFGSGGASHTAAAVLRSVGADVTVISRSGENNYGNLHLHTDAAVLINATPVGMFPETGLSPVDPARFPRLEGVLDLIYNPARTQLLMEAARLGVPAMNGLWMLTAQAKESAEWFTGTSIAEERIPQIYATVKARTENIILVGMPGCGKSTVAAIAAKKLGRSVADTDEFIQNKTGRAIPAILAEDGLEAFRRLETEAVTVLGRQSGLVIATGGGCVTTEANYSRLHQNGTIFWLRRALASLPTRGRPLSQEGRLEEMYRARQPLYQRFADHIIDNDGTPEEAAAAIAAKWEENR